MGEKKLIYYQLRRCHRYALSNRLCKRDTRQVDTDYNPGKYRWLKTNKAQKIYEAWRKNYLQWCKCA